MFGSGDWNDGMNRVGIEGRGESVWLGWFLCAVLESFSRRDGEVETPDTELAANWRAQATALAKSIEQSAGTVNGICAASSTMARRWDAM